MIEAQIRNRWLEAILCKFKSNLHKEPQVTSQTQLMGKKRSKLLGIILPPVVELSAVKLVLHAIRLGRVRVRDLVNATKETKPSRTQGVTEKRLVEKVTKQLKRQKEMLNPVPNSASATRSLVSPRPRSKLVQLGRRDRIRLLASRRRAVTWQAIKSMVLR